MQSRIAVLAVAGLALASGAQYAQAQAACNAGVQYFDLAGYDTAAVFADGIQSSSPDFLFGAQAPLVKRAMERRGYPSDPLEIGNNILFLDTGSDRILFDSGNGPDSEGAGFLTTSLEAQGISRDSITQVLLTHAHPDHISGLLLDENGTFAFPEATVHINRAEFEYWTNLEESSETISGILEQVEPQVVMFEFGEEVLPNITAALNGTWHTPGSTVYKIAAADGAVLYYAGDAVTHEIFGIANPYFTFVFDADAPAGPIGRVGLLDTIAEEKAMFITTHTTFPALGYVLKDGMYFELQKIPQKFSAAVFTICGA